MVTRTLTTQRPDINLPVVDDDFIDESFERVTGAELVFGNDVQLLIDATENYPEWLSAIEKAEKRIFFESYIIHQDEQGESPGAERIHAGRHDRFPESRRRLGGDGPAGDDAAAGRGRDGHD